jgi:hypothetical protein
MGSRMWKNRWPTNFFKMPICIVPMTDNQQLFTKHFLYYIQGSTTSNLIFQNFDN